jgi:hypothetical protein
MDLGVHMDESATHIRSRSAACKMETATYNAARALLRRVNGTDAELRRCVDQLRKLLLAADLQNPHRASKQYLEPASPLPVGTVGPGALLPLDALRPAAWPDVVRDALRRPWR